MGRVTVSAELVPQPDVLGIAERLLKREYRPNFIAREFMKDLRRLVARAKRKERK